MALEIARQDLRAQHVEGCKSLLIAVEDMLKGRDGAWPEFKAAVAKSFSTHEIPDDLRNELQALGLGTSPPASPAPVSPAPTSPPPTGTAGDIGIGPQVPKVVPAAAADVKAPVPAGGVTPGPAPAPSPPIPSVTKMTPPVPTTSVPAGPPAPVTGGPPIPAGTSIPVAPVVPPVVVPAIPHVTAAPPVVVDGVGGVDHSVPPPPAAYVVAPIAPPPAPVAAASPPEPSGPLPAYGSDDLRVTPAVSTMPASPPPAPVATSGGGATAVPAAPTSGLAVVRQPAPTPTSTSASSQAGVLGETAAASAGLVVGRAAHVAVEQQRCADIVNAVARQEPLLRWAAGTRTDGVTVLVTDLAGGWIPPGIGIPSDVTLIDSGAFKPGRTLR